MSCCSHAAFVRYIALSEVNISLSIVSEEGMPKNLTIVM